MDIEDIKNSLNKIVNSNTTNSNVAKTTLDYINNLERDIISKNNKIESLLIDIKKKNNTIEILDEFLS